MKSTNITVRYAETDQMGIAHHSNYPIWYEEARTNLIKNIGFSYSKLEKMGILLPVYSINCKYIKPSYYEDVLNIYTKIINLTPIKIEFEYRIYIENILINTGYSIHPFVNKDFNIINLKKNFPDILEKISKFKEANYEKSNS